MSTPLAIGQLLLGTADLPGVSSIASAVAESAAQDRIPWSALDYSGQTITAISGSAIGGQVDTSQFYPTSNPSGFITGVDASAISSKADKSALSSMIPYSALDYSAGTQDITGISGSSFGVSGMTLIFDSSMNQTFSGNSSTVGVDVGSFIRAVGDASEATAANILYIVTGSVIV